MGAGPDLFRQQNTVGIMAWVQIQEKTFTRWCNVHLAQRGIQLKELTRGELSDGLVLINLLEVISDKKLPRHNKHPKIMPQKLENCGISLAFIKSEGLKLVNIGPEDIVNGTPKLILGLIWTLILRYQVAGCSETESAKNVLLEWVRSKIGKDVPNYGYDINNFGTNWNDGKALCALVNALEPGLCPDHKEKNAADKVKNCQEGMDKALQDMGIPQLLDAKDLANPKVDEQSVMTYISYFRDYEQKGARRTKWADKCRAFGPGLQEGVAEEAAAFTVVTPKEMPKDKELKIVVEGPKDKAEVKCTPKGDGSYDVEYTPSTPGDYKVSITVAGDHIPGSVFHVTVLENASLGGEGKIRVYYSTTNASDQARNDVAMLQKLLEEKAIHLRDDFEPWIPVDLLEKQDRETVFKIAGSRVLPIVIIDEKYVGDRRRCEELEKTGELDKLLKSNAAKVAMLRQQSMAK